MYAPFHLLLPAGLLCRIGEMSSKKKKKKIKKNVGLVVDFMHGVIFGQIMFFSIVTTAVRVPPPVSVVWPVMLDHRLEWKQIECADSSMRRAVTRISLGSAASSWAKAGVAMMPVSEDVKHSATLSMDFFIFVSPFYLFCQSLRLGIREPSSRCHPRRARRRTSKAHRHPGSTHIE